MRGTTAMHAPLSFSGLVDENKMPVPKRLWLGFRAILCLMRGQTKGPFSDGWRSLYYEHR
jgi:hypothetical protein